MLSRFPDDFGTTIGLESGVLPQAAKRIDARQHALNSGGLTTTPPNTRTVFKGQQKDIRLSTAIWWRRRSARRCGSWRSSWRHGWRWCLWRRRRRRHISINQFNIKYQRGLWRNYWRTTLLAVRQTPRNNQLALLANFHWLHALSPTFNHAVQAKFNWLSALNAAVKFLAVHQVAAVIHLHH